MEIQHEENNQEEIKENNQEVVVQEDAAQQASTSWFSYVYNNVRDFISPLIHQPSNIMRSAIRPLNDLISPIINPSNNERVNFRVNRNQDRGLANEARKEINENQSNFAS